MTTKQIKQLAITSYSGNLLDGKRVSRITKLLNRTQLKRYINFLKNLEKAKTVKVIMSDMNTKSALTKELGAIFRGKRLEFSEDKSLIAGIKLVDNDIIYDFNLKNTFENLVSYINN